MAPVLPPDWEQRLRASGHRVTDQRRTVLEIVCTHRHVTPDQVCELAKERGQALDLSTVYRVLEMMDEVGLVTHAHIGAGSPTYHPVDAHPHVHLKCRTCDQVTSIDAEHFATMKTVVSNETGFAVDVSHLVLHGECRQCQAARVESASHGNKGER